jgi:hypothetical protein
VPSGFPQVLDPRFRALMSGEALAKCAHPHRHSGERRNPVKYLREAPIILGFVRFARCTKLDSGVRRNDGREISGQPDI